MIPDLDPGIETAVELLQAEGLTTCDSGDGYSKVEAIADDEALNYGHVFVRVNQGLSAADVVAAAKAIPWTGYGYQVPTVEILSWPGGVVVAGEPEIVGVYWQPGALQAPQAPEAAQDTPEAAPVDSGAAGAAE